MTPEEINTRMNILVGLRGFSIVKLTEKTALWRMVSDDELLIDVSFPSDLWEAKHKGKSYGIKDSGLPAQTRNMIEALTQDYDKACESLSVNAGPSKVPAPAKKKTPAVKTSKKTPELPGMCLPIAYPPELVGSFMQFKQWTANNDVIPKESEVVLLGENEQNYRVHIPKAHISFDIKKTFVEVIQA